MRTTESRSGGVYGQRGTLVRLAYLATAAVWWLAGRLGARGADKAVVLCYHGILPRQRERFAWQMRCIAGRAIGVSELTSGSPGNARRPRVCVTFDDGFACLLDTALPIMRELGIPATVFLVTGNLGDRPRWQMPAGHPEADEPVMTPDQVRAAAQSGLCRIGSHTMTHPDLAALPAEQRRNELRDSKADLEQLLNEKVEDLALPYGSCTPEVLTACFAAGYRRVHTLTHTPYDLNLGHGVVGRFSMSPGAWGLEFRLTCAGAYAWLAPWRRFIRRVRRVFASRSRGSPAPA